MTKEVLGSATPTLFNVVLMDIDEVKDDDPEQG